MKMEVRPAGEWHRRDVLDAGSGPLAEPALGTWCVSQIDKERRKFFLEIRDWIEVSCPENGDKTVFMLRALRRNRILWALQE
jgi:hypothetical protein